MGIRTNRDTDRRDRHQRGRARWGRRATGITIATLVLTACAGDNDDSAAGDDAPAAATFDDTLGFDDAGEEMSEEIGESVAAAGRQSGGSLPGDAGIDIGSIGRDVIIEMRVTMTSVDLERSVRTISTDAAELGGGVASSDVRYSDGADDRDDGFALLVIKIPPGAVDQMLGRLDEAGSVRAINQSAQDVTDQLVDLDVRIRNARLSVETVRAFMERTTDLGDLVSLEAELTRRQTDLERLEAQQRNLSDRVAASTLTIEILPAAQTADPAEPGGDSIAGALRTGWEAFVTAMFAIGFVVAVLAPFIVIAAIVGFGLWLVRRQRTARRRADHATSTGTAPPATETGTPTPVGVSGSDASGSAPTDRPTD